MSISARNTPLILLASDAGHPLLMEDEYSPVDGFAVILLSVSNTPQDILY